MSLVTGPVASLFLRFLHRALNSRTSWRGHVTLDSAAIGELRFWQSSLEKFSSKPIWRPRSLIITLQYDAGADGWGGHLIVNGVTYDARGAWAPDERHGVKSSTWRKLEGLYRLPLSVGHLVKGSRIVARGDALNVFYLLERGGSKAEHLQLICLKVFWLCRSLNVDLVPDWVPREQNILADYLSKLKDLDDFGLQPAVFETICQQFGRPDVNRFASAHNALLLVFFFEEWCPGSSGVNAFTTNWSGSRSFCFPPPRLVAGVLEHARECRSSIVLVVLEWTG
jgi:hypothetical protein